MPPPIFPLNLFISSLPAFDWLPTLPGPTLFSSPCVTHHTTTFQRFSKLPLGKKNRLLNCWAVWCNPRRGCHFPSIHTELQSLLGSCHMAQRWNDLLCFPNTSSVFCFQILYFLYVILNSNVNL